VFFMFDRWHIFELLAIDHTYLMVVQLCMASELDFTCISRGFVPLWSLMELIRFLLLIPRRDSKVHWWRQGYAWSNQNWVWSRIGAEYKVVEDDFMVTDEKYLTYYPFPWHCYGWDKIHYIWGLIFSLRFKRVVHQIFRVRISEPLTKVQFP